MWNKVFNRLPDNYSREGQVNNEKLHKVIYGELEEIKKVFEDIKLNHDIDNATGKTLDLIGKNVLEYRGVGFDDELYRQYIKTKIIANLSEGNIETINKVADFLFKDRYIGAKETWNRPGYEDLAGIAIEIKDQVQIPDILNRVKAGGVKLYWESLVLDIIVEIMLRTYEFNVPYKICNMFKTAEVPGGLMKAPIILESKAYAVDVLYPICNTFVTSQITVENNQINVILANEYRNNEVLFKRVGSVRVGEGDI